MEVLGMRTWLDSFSRFSISLCYLSASFNDWGEDSISPGVSSLHHCLVSPAGWRAVSFWSSVGEEGRKMLEGMFEAMRISKKNDYSSPQYHLCGNQLKAVSEVKDLGIYITSNLSWSMQANKCANKANRALGNIKRTVGPKNPQLFSKLYKSLVRPILEYCSPVWCPHLKKDLNTLEKVQRRASKCALGNIGQDMPYEERLNLLKWPTLEQRRLFSSLIECYKTINSLNGLDPSAFFTFANDFRPLRADHRFKLKLASATLNSFKQSFFIRITDKWNNLPKEIAEAENLNIFKNRLKRHLIDFSSVY